MMLEKPTRVYSIQSKQLGLDSVPGQLYVEIVDFIWKTMVFTVDDFRKFCTCISRPSMFFCVAALITFPNA